MTLRASLLALALIGGLHASATAAPLPAPACELSNAVVLVHGYRDTGRIFGPMGRRLTARGFRVYTPTLAPSDGSVPLDTLAARLSAYVDATLPAGACFGLVGYSMGGLVARAYAQALPDSGRVTSLVTLSTPHRGTLSAYTRRGPGTRQMRPGSAFLRALDANAGRLADVPFTSFWTPLDLVIVPASSSRVPFAAGGPVFEVAHPMMYLSPRVARRVAAALRAAERARAAPTPAGPGTARPTAAG